MPAPIAIEGILAPVIVPLTPDGDINEPELRRFVDWLVSKGIHGLYPNGSTSEFTRYTPEERRRIVRIVCEQAAGRVPVVAGAAEANLRETLKACETYLGYGARAAAIVSPFYYQHSSDTLYSYYREIALNSPIDINLYNIPRFASPIDLDTTRRLAELPRIIGLKESSGDLSFMLRLMSTIRPNRPDFIFLAGAEAILVPMLIAGVNGATLASANVVPDLLTHLYRLTRSGKLDEANTLQQRFIPLIDAMRDPIDFPEGFRAGLEARGIAAGMGRMPLSDRRKAVRSQITRTVADLLKEWQGIVTLPPSS